MKKRLLIISIAMRIFSVQAQQACPVTDTQPVLIDGLQIGYNIKSQEIKAVGDKGNFSRYSVKFYVTNTLNDAKIMLYKQGFNPFNNTSDQLVQFNCLNATGARLTAKSAVISASPCNVLAQVDDKDCGSNKITQNRRSVQIGFWIKPGQTISADAILIVPLNDKPNVQAVYLANTVQQMASATVAEQPYVGQPYQDQPPTQQAYSQAFARIRNIRTNTYLNNQTGAAASTLIQNGWWSAQWQVIPVPGTAYVNIKNRWKGNYLTTDTGIDGIGMFVNYMSDGARWILEQMPGTNALRIKNVATGGYLCIASNQLKLAKNYNNVMTADWIIEQ